MTPPLLVTRDPMLLDELGRLAAAAGAALTPMADPAEALRGWTSAPVVLVGLDQAEAVVAIAPPRRPQVHLVARRPTPEAAFRLAVALGAEGVVELPDGAARVAELLTDLGDDGRAPGRVVGVVAGSGGAGATTLACALCQVAARDGTAVVLDTDPLGPGADRVLGLDATPGVRWGDLGQTTGRLGARSLRDALPSRAGLAVLTWEAGSVAALSPALVRETLSAARRGHDLVVVDLPRSTDPLIEEVALRCDLVVVVARPTVSSVAATVRLLDRYPGRDTLRLVARGSGIDAEQLATVTGLPLLATMPHQRGLAESVDLGLGPVRGRRGPLARTATKVLAQVAA